jgi:thiamine biosynthesis lipoprotein
LARGDWEVAVEDPQNPRKPLRTLKLTDAGLATSGFYLATKELADTKTHHLLSPQTGRPVEATATLAAVVAPTALEADGWATAILATGLPEALALAEQQKLGALIVDTSGQPHITSRGARVFADP